MRVALGVNQQISMIHELSHHMCNFQERKVKKKQKHTHNAIHQNRDSLEIRIKVSHHPKAEYVFSFVWNPWTTWRDEWEFAMQQMSILEHQLQRSSELQSRECICLWKKSDWCAHWIQRWRFSKSAHFQSNTLHHCVCIVLNEWWWFIGISMKELIYRKVYERKQDGAIGERRRVKRDNMEILLTWQTTFEMALLYHYRYFKYSFHRYFFKLYTHIHTWIIYKHCVTVFAFPSPLTSYK